QDFEHPVVPFEGCCFAVACPFGLEDDLRRLAIVGRAPLGDPPWSSTMLGGRARALSSRSQIRRWSLKSSPPVKAILGPAGMSGSFSTRRLAARKSRLSIMVAV